MNESIIKTIKNIKILKGTEIPYLIQKYFTGEDSYTLQHDVFIPVESILIKSENSFNVKNKQGVSLGVDNINLFAYIGKIALVQGSIETIKKIETENSL